MTDMAPIALTIAGSDASGGAGIQADLKTFHQLGVYGQAAITLITVQNSLCLSRVEVLPVDLVAEQIAALLEDCPPAAAKTGALGSIAIVEAIARMAAAFAFPLVVDPVMVSKHGRSLFPAEAVEALLTHLLPVAALVTPNLDEAEALTGIPVRTPANMREAARRLHGRGARAVLVKGGHLAGDAGSDAIDILYDGAEFREFSAPRIATRHTHGTGCTYSAAITAGLARGLALADAVGRAKQFISEAIRTNPGLGHGAGPVNHFAEAP
jgi:hydroxymethylpyrimidine/phosphomethylpyrimidine kinase